MTYRDTESETTDAQRAVGIEIVPIVEIGDINIKAWRKEFRLLLRADKLTVSKMTLTTKMVEDMLACQRTPENYDDRKGSEKDVKRNRTQRKGTIRRFYQLMKDKLWLFTHQGIAFDKEGYLLDGGHRLLAALKSGCAFTTLVFFGCEVKTFDALDSGGNRSGPELLEIRGKDNTGPLGTTLRFMNLWRNGICSKLAVSVRPADYKETSKTLAQMRTGGLGGSLRPNEIAASVGYFPGLIESIAAGVDIGLFNNRKNTSGVSNAVLGGCYHLIRQKDVEEARKFMLGLCFADNIPMEGPVAELRKYIAAGVPGDAKAHIVCRKKMPEAEMAVAIIKTWNNLRTGVHGRSIDWPKDEGFPNVK